MQRIQNLRLRFSVLACLTVAGLTVNTVAAAQCVVAISSNTCFGTDVLQANTTGAGDSGFGSAVLYSNTEGTANSGFGYQALLSNTTGHYNTASGTFAMLFNSTGNYNVASGYGALYSNSTGYENTASGNQALVGNATGFYNTASGSFALSSLGAGNRNTADGALALANATGSRNVALGFNAGSAITTGADNIMICAGQKGKAKDSGVIRIGSSNFQKKALIAGIRGVTTGLANAVPVVIDGNGQLGTVSSSRRFKEDIQPMADASERLYALRPVTFRYKQPYEDGATPVQFGLVAEEVAEVFPELVVYGEDGEPETVGYHVLATLLLNEVQKQRQVMQDQTARISTLERQSQELAQLQAQVAAMAEVIDRLNDIQRLASQ